MLRQLIHMACFALTSFILTACGGGSESGGYDAIIQPLYGSIAINQNTGAGGITAKYSSQSSANNKALEQCGFSCTTVLEYGSNQCGALARGDNLVFGWASHTKKSTAESDAINQCVSRSGKNCQIILSECNSS